MIRIIITVMLYLSIIMMLKVTETVESVMYGGASTIPELDLTINYITLHSIMNMPT